MSGPHRELTEQEQEYLRILNKCKEDFSFFCKDILGYKDLNKHHMSLCSSLQHSPKKRKIILYPRYAFKSSIITCGFALWKMLKHPNLRILIYSDKLDKAQSFLTDIKNHIEGRARNSKFREYFGEWETDPHKGKWNESEIIISKRTFSHREPTVDTGGIEGSKVGLHYDLIFFDDIVSDRNITTKDQMDKVHECYRKSLSLLKPGGEVIIVGTRWHFGDLYGRLIEESKEAGTFDLHIRDAEEKNEDGTLIFEDIGLTREFLDQQRHTQGSTLYSCIYRNNPVDAENATFKYADFKFYGRLKESLNPLKTGLYKELYITGVIDPAGMGEDFTAITVVGTDKALRMYVLDIVNAKLQTNQMVDKIIDLHRKYRFKRFGVETIFFRGQLKKELELSIEANRVIEGFQPFKVDELKTRWTKGEGKHQRISALQPFHERGDVLFPGESFEKLTGAFRELGFQMIQYPASRHDDIIDSLSWHVQIISRGNTPKKAGPPKGSIAQIEREWIRNKMNAQNRIPRKYRKIYKPVLS